jgi:serine/threonine-protein kinase
MDEGEVVWGTPAYFAPEQASGGRVLPATDVYAVGIILYEMLTGRVPFVGVDDQEVARKQIYEAHIPVDQINPRIPEPLARIVDAAMAKNPNERFLTADHLREALLMYKQGALMQTGFEAPISAVVGSPVQAGSPPARPRGRPSPRSRRSSGPIRLDYLLLLLGLVAIIAILGLVPLLVALYNAYQPGLGGSAAPAPDLPPGQVRMPDIVGLEESAARSALHNMGLELVVDGEEPHPTLPAFAIVKQSVDPGAAVGEGSTVHVTLSQGPPLIEVPELVGLRYEEAEQLLQSLDLATQKYEDWSVETPGNIVTQDPPAGSLVENRTLITLVVSNGSRTPVGANLGGQILLTAYDIPRLQYRPGEAISLTFFWQAITPLTENYNLFIYLTTPQGGIVSEIDTQPLGSPLTSSWQVGQIVADPYQLSIPPTTVTGDYQIRIGFYNPVTNTRLAVAEPGRAEQDNLGALILRTVQVVQ